MIEFSIKGTYPSSWSIYIYLTSMEKTMNSKNSEILYRGWRIEPFAIPSATGSWVGTCEIRKLDGTSSDSTLTSIDNVVRDTKDEAIADICKNAQRVIDASCAFPYPTLEPS